MASAHAHVRLVHKRSENYPEPDKDTARPFRVWNPRDNAYVMGRWYVSEFRAIKEAAFYAKYYLPIGQSVEVLDVRKGKWLGTYTKKIGGVFYEQYDTDENILARYLRSMQG